MSQSNVILGTLVFAFLVFVTVRGGLKEYLGIIGIGEPWKVGS